MGWKIDWTQPALEDLAEIVGYITQDDRETAIRFGDKIVNHVDILETFPEIGPIYRRRPGGDVRQILSSPFKVFYRINRRTQIVEILLVWHGARQDPDDL